MTFNTLLRQPQPVFLDGATGSELSKVGISLELPLWSACALLDNASSKLLRRLHAEYALAGADILTANTFRTNYHTLSKENLQNDSARLTQKAVDLVRLAIDDADLTRRILVAGSIGPSEDCYRPDLKPDTSTLWDDHHRHIDNLYEAGVDLLLIETMNNAEESIICAEYAGQADIPFVISFLTDAKGNLYSGDAVRDCAEIISVFEPAAYMINCVPVSDVSAGLHELASGNYSPLGVYANVGHRNHVDVEMEVEYHPESYAKAVQGWAEIFKLALIGGCCGTTPEHIRALRNLFELNAQ